MHAHRHILNKLMSQNYNECLEKENTHLLRFVCLVLMIIEKTLAPGIVCALRSFTVINTAQIGANENHYSMQLKHDTPKQSM